MLRTLKAAGLKTAVLSNGSPRMLKAAVASAGIAKLLDAVLSVDAVGIYKPDPRVYQLGEKALRVKAARACFLSSNAWDAWAAANFGYRVVWVNRFGQKPERLPGRIVGEIKTLAELPGLLGL
jgi:2-haloacid dehalogenase